MAARVAFQFRLPDWWQIALRGLVALVFGFVALVWPGVTLSAFVLIFGGFALAYGVVSLVSGMANRDGRSIDWGGIGAGLVAIVVGVITFFWPGITALALAYVVAAWAIATGLIQVGTAVALRKLIRGEWLLALAGVLSVALGIVLVLFPTAGAMSLSMVIGAYAMVFGTLLIALGFRLRTGGPLPRPG